ncbi:hypothetical protein BDV25DRAFT_97547 [Aspergillus avenaceus]|uniref:Uncharacterized protein n=1 Tax=Aspergillus avenaceus TaxID=36643 RepID=A0A5N6TY42_ASPAV|nr:hypothetical protein BDV25DRAFT_97547 [Aspergillus avenaceus]
MKFITLLQFSRLLFSFSVTEMHVSIPGLSPSFLFYFFFLSSYFSLNSRVLQAAYVHLESYRNVVNACYASTSHPQIPE